MERPYLFSLTLKLQDGEKNINEVATFFWRIISELSILDSQFKRFTISKEGHDFIVFDLTDVSDEVSVQKVAVAILSLSTPCSDIGTNSDKIEQSGFSWIANFSINEKDDFYLTFRLGSKQSNSIGNFNFPKKMTMDLVWVYNIFKCLVNVCEPTRGGVYFVNSEVNAIAQNSKIPVGLITYIPHKSGVNENIAFQPLQYEELREGKIYILERDDISSDQSLYKKAKEKAIFLMKQNN